MFETERKQALAGIGKCDEFLKNWDMNGFAKGEIEICECADKVPPQEVAETFAKFNREILKGGGELDKDFCLVIFYANAKYGFILRLAKMQEKEDALSMA